MLLHCFYIMHILKVPSHPFYVGVKFHPKSQRGNPFSLFICICIHLWNISFKIKMNKKKKKWENQQPGRIYCWYLYWGLFMGGFLAKILILDCRYEISNNMSVGTWNHMWRQIRIIYYVFLLEFGNTIVLCAWRDSQFSSWRCSKVWKRFFL